MAWIGTVPRDALSVAAKNSLNSVTTMFQVPAETAANLAAGPSPTASLVDSAAEAAAEQELFVAGLLRAMGYKTRLSPVGRDHGRDIFASPDGLGLEDSRIVVEVKHRSGAIGAPAVRSS